MISHAELNLRYSRITASANRLGEDAPDRHRFVDKRVLLTGELETLMGANGRTQLLMSLRLLVRICPNVTVSLPAGTDLEAECRREAERIAFGSPVKFEPEADPGQYDAILSIGTRVRADRPWTTINSNGWLVRVSSGGGDLPFGSSQANPIGALGAAALGTAEVFKRLLAVKPERAEMAIGVAFSLFTYEVGEVGPGPELPDEIPLNLLLVGNGAIGNGIVALVRELPARGRVAIVDGQAFGEENLGTCILVGPDDVGQDKALVAERWLSSCLAATGYSERVNAFARRVHAREVPVPAIVVNGLDNVEARRASQMLWPDLMIDGAIGDFMCQVSRHPWGEDTACLRCIYPEPAGQDSDVLAQRATGLSPARLATPNSTVSDEDVANAPEERRKFLQERRGKPICSVTSEGVALAISAQEQRAGFEPSTPFVACLSAAMVMGELVKAIGGWSSPLEPRFQFDVLRGPANGLDFPESRHPGCDCTARAQNINKLREMRQAV